MMPGPTPFRVAGDFYTVSDFQQGMPVPSLRGDPGYFRSSAAVKRDAQHTANPPSAVSPAPVNPARSQSLRGQCHSFLHWFLLAGPFLLATFSTAIQGDVRADVIELRRGGSHEGKILRQPEENGGFYEIELANGGILRIDKREVERVVQPQSSVSVYQSELANHDLATVAGQMEMVKWCQEQRLRVQKAKHLRKIIEIDPDHEAARRLLGYTRHIVTGKWVVREEYYQSIGYVGQGASMRLPAGLLVDNEKKKHAEAVRDWNVRINRLLTLLKNQRKFAEAKAELEGIEDPKAIPVLISNYQKIGKRGTLSDFDREVKSMILNLVGRFDILSARSFLVEVALFEPNDVLQDEAERLVKSGFAEWAAEYLVARLKRIRPTIVEMVPDAMAVRDRDFVARAAVILKGLETDTSEAVLPLINLVVLERLLPPLKPQKKGGLGGASFGKDGGVAMNQGSEKPKPRPIRIDMVTVQTVLTGMTEQRFGNDKNSWLQWYLSRTLPGTVDLRRLD